PYGRASAVTTYEIPAVDRSPFAGIEIVRHRGDALSILGQLLETCAIENANARLLRGMPKQDRLKKQLVDPIRRIRSWPPAIITPFAARSTRPRRQFDPRKLHTGCRYTA